MARVNSGLNTIYLSDAHLIAESVEITMITGQLRMHDYQIKGAIPKHYTLGKGHMNFFKDKLVYLKNRLDAVNEEMKRRGFKPGTHIDLKEFPIKLHGDWKPRIQDTITLRARVADRLLNPKSGKVGSEYHRYMGKVLGEDIKEFHSNILKSQLYHL